MSYDTIEILAQFAKRRSIEFPLLSDPGSETIKAWQLLNEEAKGGSEGVPHPMTYLIDQSGVIRSKLGHEGYQIRHTVQELLDAAKPATQKKKP